MEEGLKKFRRTWSNAHPARIAGKPQITWYQGYNYVKGVPHAAIIGYNGETGKAVGITGTTKTAIKDHLQTNPTWWIETGELPGTGDQYFGINLTNWDYFTNSENYKITEFQNLTDENLGTVFQKLEDIFSMSGLMFMDGERYADNINVDNIGAKIDEYLGEGGLDALYATLET